jgi:hypothetical protein
MAPLVALLALAGHVVDVSEGTVVVDDDVAGGRVVVVVELAFARADAARLPAAPILVDGVGCVVDGVAARDVEEDGRVVTAAARCARHADVFVDVAGLGALPPSHRLALRVVDDAERFLVLAPSSTRVLVPARSAPPDRAVAPHLASLSVFLAVVVCVVFVAVVAPAARRRWRRGR